MKWAIGIAIIVFLYFLVKAILYDMGDMGKGK